MKLRSLAVFALLAAPLEAATTGPLSTYLVEPCRFLDTRDDETFWYERPGAFYAGETRLYQVTEHCDVPLGAQGVIINVTVTGTSSAGHVSIWRPDNGKPLPPNTSILNFGRGTTTANGSIVRLNPIYLSGSADADLRIYAHAPSGSVHVIIDVVGYLK